MMADVRAYRVLLTPDPEDGGFTVRVPAFPAIITQGDDVQDALAMAQDAIRLELAEAREAGVHPPAPDADGDVLVETVVVEAPAA
jgi:predicted RNase H-like HicB family nuclease